MGTQNSPEEQAPAKRRLGRGLNALLGGGAPSEGSQGNNSGTQLTDIDVRLIDRNPFQPRKAFEAEAIGELVDSIKQHGILQPLLVREHEHRYQLIAGERRWLAAQQAGFNTVPCRVFEMEDQRVCEVAIEENLKRKDLNVLEKAQAFQDYIERFGSTIEELAKQLSMNRSTVSNYLRLLELPEVVKQSLAAETISNGHARALLPLEEADQIALCQRIEAESLSVRKTEQAVRNVLKGEDAATIPFPKEKIKPETPQPSAHVLSLQTQLQQHMGLKVEIRVTGKTSGKIVIPFDTNEEFASVVRQLRKAA